MDHLINLKTLDLAENYIESLEGLEKLKNLERLNLSNHKISDFSLLNTFPKLREVNVPSSNIKKEDIEKQLDKPEILLWVYSPFRIGLEKSLYISGN
ncbi:leucine-rich repeat domain-containing protein [Chryseobacterium gambrini]|uniref:leucine-rich repeat domain-containing protein n=1 Tax=Chryseobacterium gambrini TaxID=373672 RepID=UPI00339EBCE7